MIRRFAAACAIAAVLALPSGPLAAATTLEIPVLLPLTGTAAFLGAGQSASLNVLQRYVNAHGGVNGHPLAFVIQDDQSSPSNAVQMANAVIARRGPVLLGPAFTSECLAVAPLIKSGPVTYCTSPGLTPPAGSYVYSAGIAGAANAVLLARYFHLRGLDRIALIASTDASGQAFATALNQTLNMHEFGSMHLIASEHFSVGDLSVAAQMARIKAAAPQAVIEWTAGTAFATLLRGTQEVGLDVPIAGGNANMTYTQMAQYASFLPKLLYFPAVSGSTLDGVGAGPIHDAQTLYFRAFKAAGVRPDFQSNIVWDPAMIVVAAFRAVGVDATADQIQGYIQNLHSWVGVNGVYDFRDGSQRGIGVGVGVVAVWDPKRNDFVAVSRLGGVPK